MCTSNSSECMSRPLHFPTWKPKSKARRVRIPRLNRTNDFTKEKIEEEMELRNLKLFMENINILKENEKLRKKANLLHQENLALMSQLANKFSHFNRLSTTLFVLDHLHRH